VHTRGINLYYETIGKGKPLLFIHGNGGDLHSFDKNIPYFAKQYQVIAVDSRSQGKSIDLKDSLSFEMMADDFNALLDSLHLKNAYVIGWSDGGINGLYLAIRHPDKVKMLAISGANLWPDSSALKPSMITDMWKEHNILLKESLTADEKNKLKIVDLDLFQPNMSLAQLHTIHCPALVIGGDHDLIPPLHTALIAANIYNANLWIIPNCGHATPMEKRELFNTEVNSFFNGKYK
jgi:pimeloyl-ACP methyl ester carboxylesterase